MSKPQEEVRSANWSKFKTADEWIKARDGHRAANWKILLDAFQNSWDSVKSVQDIKKFVSEYDKMIYNEIGVCPGE